MVQLIPVVPAIVAEAAPLRVLDAQDDDLDAEDHLDPDLLPIFEEEATELLPQLGSALRQWVARPENLGARQEVLRLLHTLKGSARLAGAMRVGEMAHRMESSIELLGAEGLQSVQLEPLLGRFDALQGAFAALGHVPVEGAAQVATEHATKPVEVAAVAASASTTNVPKSLPAIQAPVVAATPRIQGNQSVRVRAQLLDRLVNQAGEVMITRSRMDERDAVAQFPRRAHRQPGPIASAVARCGVAGGVANAIPFGTNQRLCPSVRSAGI